MATVAKVEFLGPAQRARREAQGVSLRRLAARSSIPPTTLSEIELGKVTKLSWLVLWRLAAVLDCTIEDLVHDVEREVPR